MYHACRDLAHSRDLNDKASSGQCTTFKTKTRARIACLVDAYKAWHRYLPPDIRGESHPLSVEACLSEDVSKQALANGAGALDAEHAPLPLILLSIRSTNKTKRAIEHRAIKTNDPQFDDIRSNPPDDYRPTSEGLRKKFEEYFDMFLALLRPTDAPERYSAITDICAEAALSSKFNLTDAKGKATWYLFCVLHDLGLLAPGNFGK
jgi:hypothetical protein